MCIGLHRESARMDQITTPRSSKHHPCLECISRFQCLNSCLTPEQIGKLNNLYVKKISLKRGESLYRNGDKLNSIYNVRAGVLKNELNHADGRQQVIKFYFPGELTGLDGIQDGRYRTETSALTDAEVCCFNYQELLSVANTYPTLQKNLDQLISSILNSVHEHLFLLGFLNASEKLAIFLLQFADKLEDHGFSSKEFYLPMNREELSSYLGITIETLSRSFTHLTKSNILETSNKKIVILQKEKLKSICIKE